MQKPVWIWSLVLAVLCAACIAAGAPAFGANAKPVLRYASEGAPVNLDPAIEVNAYVLDLAYAPLIHIKPDGSYAPGLATAWSYVGSGNRTFQLTLRQDARFSDGSTVDAQAVKKWMTYFAGAGGAFAKNIPFKTIQTVGRWKVVIHLSRAEPNMRFLLSEIDMSGFVGSPEMLAHPNQLKTRTDGAGPYMIDPAETVPGDHYTFVPNPYYYDPSAVRYSKVVYGSISQPSAMLAALQTGQIDMGYGDLSTVAKAEAAGFGVVSSPNGWVGIMFLDRGPLTPDGSQPNPLAKLQVRQALNYAVDRAALAKSFLGKYGTPTSEPPTLDGWDPKVANYYPYDPAKAKQLLAAAGYPNGFTLEAMSMSFKGTLGDPFLQAVGSYLSKVGVKLDITPEATGAAWLPQYLAAGFQSTGFVEGPVLSAYEMYSDWFGPQSYVKARGWSDPTLGSLFTAGTSAPDPTANAKKLAARVVTQADWLVVATNNTMWYVSKHLGGVAYSASTAYPLPTEWYPR